MRDLKNKLTSSKSTKNTQTRKGKSFGYQVLGFGAGGGSENFLCASGGTITESGDYKIHTFLDLVLLQLLLYLMIQLMIM